MAKVSNIEEWLLLQWTTKDLNFHLRPWNSDLTEKQQCRTSIRNPSWFLLSCLFFWLKYWECLYKSDINCLQWNLRYLPPLQYLKIFLWYIVLSKEVAKLAALGETQNFSFLYNFFGKFMNFHIYGQHVCQMKAQDNLNS